MHTFRDYYNRQQYSRMEELGDKLGEMKTIIDWEVFRPILSDMYKDNEVEGGRPHHDEILLVKIMILQAWYGLSDYEAERQANDRISFQHFLDYPEVIPDRSTIWK
jgi:IS5 family transposase